MSQITSQELESYLDRFGLESFRSGQKSVIESVFAQKDCLCVMPTGGGKSLCFQLPAVAFSGVTLVISPLISLMKDQVDQLNERGISATFINSTLDVKEQHRRLDEMEQGVYDLVYVVPERFRSQRFIDSAKRSNVELLAVDEAHCVSQWGHDFRPDYAKIGRFREWIGSPPTIALTATATELVREDISERLDLRDPDVYITGFDRPNLYYDVQSARGDHSKDQALIEFISKTEGSGIIYAATRKRCEDVAESLQRNTKSKVGVYHAGLMKDDRETTQERFMAGKIDIVVATNAFGMGIDKADVRYVIHYNLPGSLEAYYQEAGRAGRDGKRSTCLMMYQASDRYVQEFFIESSYPDRDQVKAVYEFLRCIDEEPIQLSLQEIKETLGLSISASGVGTCEQLLESAGVLERMDRNQAMASVEIRSPAESIVEFVPKSATVQRKVIQYFEAQLADRDGEPFYFRPEQAAAGAGLKPEQFSRALNQISQLEAVTYIPPFRGRGVRMIERTLPFESLEIDFEKLDRLREAEFEKLEQVIRFATKPVCRQKEILEYFGQEDSQPCGHCDHCDRLQIGKSSKESSPTNEAEQQTHRFAALSALRCLCSISGRFGKTILTQILAGANTQKINKFNLKRNSEYGALSFLRQTEVAEFIDALLMVGLMEQNDIDVRRPIIQITNRGLSLLDNKAKWVPLPISKALSQKLAVNLAKLSGVSESEVKSTTSGRSSGTPDENLKLKLQTWRNDEAAERGLPPHYVFPNAVLEELVSVRPESLDELNGIKGIGPSKLRRYGDQILKILHPLGTERTEQKPKRSEPQVDLFQASEPPQQTKRVEDFDQINAQFMEAQEDLDGYSSEPPTESISAPSNPTPKNSISPKSQPSHYWSWKLLDSGFTPEECCAIRNLSIDAVRDHLIQAAENNWSVELSWFLNENLIRELDRLIGNQRPEQIRPLLAQLPEGAEYEQVLYYLAYKSQQVPKN